MTHGPIVERHREQMAAVAEVLDELFNGKAKGPDRQIGFAVLVFPFGATEGGRVNYISNADREDMLTAMKEFIARAEGRIIETDTQQ